MAVAVAVAPCGAPPCAGTQGGSTFAKLGLLPEPTHTAPNPQENSCRRPKTMLIKYEAKSSRTLQSLRLLDHGLPSRQIPRILAQNSPSPRAHTRKSSLSNLQPPPTGPNPFLATLGITTTRGCTGSKLGFHSYPPQIRKAITTPKPNTMLIKSATRGPGKSSCQIQGNEDQSFKGKRLLKPQKAAKPSPKLPLWPQPTSAQPPATTALLKRPRAGYPTMDAQPVGWESGGLQARGRSATCPGFG